MEIRRAVPTDAAVLSELGAQTFIDSFGHLYSTEDLQAFLDESHSVEAYATLLASPVYAVWVAVEGDEAIGYALAGPCGLPHEDVRPEDGELKRLYVSSRAQGGGVGALQQVGGVGQAAVGDHLGPQQPGHQPGVAALQLLGPLAPVGVLLAELLDVLAREGAGSALGA